METALLKRLKRLEEVRVVETQASFELQMGYLIRLRQEYTGERHVVTVGRDGNGIYRWEERHGAPPANEDGPTSIIRLFLVRAKDGRSDYFPGADRRSHVVLLAFFPSYNALDLWVDQWRNTQIERTVVSTLVSDSLMDSCMRWRSFVRGRRMHTHESC